MPHHSSPIRTLYAAVKQYRYELALVTGILVFIVLWTVGLLTLQRAYGEGIRTFVIGEAEHDPTPVTSQVKSELPAQIPRTLDGVIVNREHAYSMPICVMIENAAFGGVRPQTSLSQASIVYEVIVEGGITRFMAVYPSEGTGDYTIGPVRSARDTYVLFASEYECPYVHAGGSPTALESLRNYRMWDMDGLIYGKYFWRDNTKYAPHNMFTSLEKLKQAAADKHWAVLDKTAFQPWKFIDALPTELRPDPSSDEGVVHISIGFGGSYDVEYNYSAEHNGYERSNGGVLQKDALNQRILTATNVIVQYVESGVAIEGKGRINWNVEGQGKVEIFHDGKRYTGIWKKEGRDARTQYLDEKGAPIPLTRGTTWVDVVPPHIAVSYQ